MSTAFQVSNTDNLEPDDMNAFSFLSRAANAIVKASDLSREVSVLSDKMSHAEAALGTLEEQRRSLEASLAIANANLANARETITEQAQRIGEKAMEIERYKADNDHLERRLSLTTRQYDEVCDMASSLTTELASAQAERDEGAAKLAKFREILGLPAEAKPLVQELAMPEPPVMDPGCCQASEPDRDLGEPIPTPVGHSEVGVDPVKGPDETVLVTTEYDNPLHIVGRDWRSLVKEATLEPTEGGQHQSEGHAVSVN